MSFQNRFHAEDKRTAKAKLGNHLHHYDDVAPVIRVGNWSEEKGGFPLSMTAPIPTDDDLAAVVEHLDENGYKTQTESDIMYVVGRAKDV